MPKANSRTPILDAAEHRMRRQGYNAVSFRDLADDIGVKSSSVHYFFPQKSDLGVALVQRYAGAFQEALRTATEGVSAYPERIDAFINLHTQALAQDGAICLCGVFGAESAGLPQEISHAVASFFDQNTDWLAAEISGAGLGAPKSKALTAIAALEGAMIMATVKNDPAIFNAIARTVKSNLCP